MGQLPDVSSGLRRRPGRVLLIDDERLVGVALSRMLHRENVVVLVPRAVEALARLNGGERYDVVLCDLRMPVMDGIEFHGQLKQTLSEEADRIVFITAGPLTVRAEAFLQGVQNLLLIKPLDIDGVRQLIDRRRRTMARVSACGPGQ